MRKPLVILFCFLLPAIVYSQEKRVALLIGNSNYQHGASLANPENDAMDLGEKLKMAGFDVSCYTDLGQTEMKKVIDEFGLKLEKADIGLFYYAGHGVQAKGRNYLIPSDAQPRTENDVEYNCVDAGRVLAKMEDASTNTNIVILDACRNNPFERSWSRNSNGNGLASMTAPGGSLIAYSTAPGKTAADGYYRNSPYTAGILEYIDTPNLKVEDLFKLVRVKVLSDTKGQQTTWESTSLTGAFTFNEDKDKDQIEVENLLPDPGDSSLEAPNYELQRRQKAAGIRSIAVMPFSNYTGDETKEYIASGVHAALIGKLQILESVKVISKTSTLSYADFNKSLKDIASELKVEGVVEASLLGAGEKLSLHLKLYSVINDEELIWSREYESDMTNVLNLYNDVTKNIAEEIQISLSVEQELELNRKNKIDKEAYDLYLRSYQHLGDGTEKANRESLESLARAIDIEPDWPILYSSMAQVWMVLQQFGHESPKVAGPKIYEYANKALELDPNSGEAHHLLGMLAFLVEWDWTKAKNEFEQAIRLMPGNPLPRLFYAQVLVILGETEEAMKHASTAISYDPVNLMVKCQYVGAILSAYHFEEGLSVLEEVLAVAPEHPLANNQMEKAAFQTGDYERVVKIAKYHIPLKEEAFIEAEKIYYEEGFVAAYSELLRQVEVEMISDYIIQPITLACKFHMIGEHEKAMYWIEKGYELRSPSIPYIATGFYDFKQLYDNPRFVDIVDKLKLPQPREREIK